MGKKTSLIVAVLLLVAGLISLIESSRQNSSAPVIPTVTPALSANSQIQEASSSAVLGVGSEKAQVTKVIDGDTIEVNLNGQFEKIRYIGIDTPETVDPRRPVGCFGKEASNENKRLVEGKLVYLTKDISETDKFNRLLRFVYIKMEDGTFLFVNDYLIRMGFARISTYPPDVKFASQFLEAEKEARENNRGLWKKCV